MVTVSSVSANPPSPWRVGLRGAQANLLPGLALQAGALVLVAAYYRHDATRELLGRLSAWRVETGFAFSFVSTALFGAGLPLLYLWLRAATRTRYDARQCAALILFWAYKGVEVDALYRLMAFCFGAGHDVRIIAVKSFFDQFVYCPFFAVPITVLAYEWIESRFDGPAVWADLRAGGWYRRRGMTVLLSSFGVWLPAVFIIYALPTPLQLPLQNLVLCFYTLLVAHVTRRNP
ncbi:MAG: hypothetical protein ACHQ5A_01690 [Opitutales bacterium]